jgi:hypothetical protein
MRLPARRAMRPPCDRSRSSARVGSARAWGPRVAGWRQVARPKRAPAEEQDARRALPQAPAPRRASTPRPAGDKVARRVERDHEDQAARSMRAAARWVRRRGHGRQSSKAHPPARCCMRVQRRCARCRRSPRLGRDSRFAPQSTSSADMRGVAGPRKAAPLRQRKARGSGRAGQTSAQCATKARRRKPRFCSLFVYFSYL